MKEQGSPNANVAFGVPDNARKGVFMAIKILAVDDHVILLAGIRMKHSNKPIIYMQPQQ